MSASVRDMNGFELMEISETPDGTERRNHSKDAPSGAMVGKGELGCFGCMVPNAAGLQG